MAELKATFHVRHVTVEGDRAGPGYLLDADAPEGACRAYQRLLREIDDFAPNKQIVDRQIAARKLEPALYRVARNYWRDFDFDDRKRSAQVKAEARKLVSPLATLIEALEDRPQFARQALNAQATTATQLPGCEGSDAFMSALAANRALLDACRAFVERKYLKGAGAIRFQNAALDLCKIWEDIFGLPFPRNTKTMPAGARHKSVGIKRTFENIAAEFVFVALFEIGNPLEGGKSWVKPSQIEDALGVVLFEGGK